MDSVDSNTQFPSPFPESMNQNQSSPIRRRPEFQEDKEPEEEDVSPSPRQDIVQHFNSRNVKVLAFSVVCGFLLYHTVLRLTHGKFN